ncbi:MAG: FAD-dependent oxidoreductase, partial [Aaplasma endosymbiont of Hyalomma asiaticum]
MKEYDVVIVGSGPGGYIAAIRAAQLGYKVAVVERESSLGGVCLNWGCIPTKSLLKSAELYKKILEAKSFGIDIIGEIRPDISAIVAHSRESVGKLNQGVAMLMKKNNIEVIPGQAKTLGKGKISVASNRGSAISISARYIILATGGSARVPAHLDTKLLWLAKDAMVPASMPRSLLIIGSGAIGLEFASFYGALGCRVTVVEMKDRILPLEDKEVSSYMCGILRSQGMEIYTNSTVQALTGTDGSVIKAEIVKNEKASSPIVAEFDKVICAIGIVPNTSNLGLENTKVKLDRTGYVVTDSMCRTDEHGMYAIGDVAGAPCLAHKASHEAVMCVEGIASAEGRIKKNVSPLNINNIPSCIYTIPQVASV